MSAPAGTASDKTLEARQARSKASSRNVTSDLAAEQVDGKGCQHPLAEHAGLPLLRFGEQASVGQGIGQSHGFLEQETSGDQFLFL